VAVRRVLAVRGRGRNHQRTPRGANVAHGHVVLRDRGAAAFVLADVRDAGVVAVFRIEVALFDLDLFPVDVELVRDKHRQRVLDALACFRVLGHDRERVVDVHLDVRARVERRGWRSGAALLREEIGVAVEADQDAAAGKRADFDKGSTIELFLHFFHGAPPKPFSRRLRRA
jgi:hypothetical protein